ncbi:MAG: DNA internalization-related competence protein ComEC/Rec2 [Gammaproteobacteria bacterium]|nr:DNA internalization-related competence protein ComEC/Rec2 [Gammaproteobacteria bacterium]
MRKGSLFFLAGILSLLIFDELPQIWLLAIAPLAVFLSIRFPVFSCPCFFICGFLWALFRADLILECRLAPELEGEKLYIEGVVSGLPERTGSSARFLFKIHKLKNSSGIPQGFPDKIRLHWFESEQDMVPGDIWQLKVKLKIPNGFRNPGGFDYEGWLFQQNIGATGYVLRDKYNKQLKSSLEEGLHRFRLQVRQKLSISLSELENWGLIPALVLGDRSALDNEEWRVLRSTGTSHLLAISGLHIGLVAGISFFLTRWLWPLGGITSILIPAPRMAAVAAILAAVLYAAMAGFSIPTQRALIMLSVFFLTIILSRKLPKSTVLSWALFLVLILDPFSVMSAGFWLSFAAIAVILFGMSSRLHNRSLWWRWGRVQLLIVVGLFPLLVFWFQQIPVFSILANVIFVPWVSMISVPLILLGSLVLWLSESSGVFFLQVGIDSINLFWPMLSALEALDISLYRFQNTTYPALCLALVGSFLLISPKGLPGKWLGLVWCLPLFFPIKEPIEKGEFRFSLLDVGQGMSAVLQTENHVLLFDAGPRFSKDFDAGSAVVLPYLAKAGVNEVDILIQSHGDNDHIGGLAKILESLAIGQILTSVPDSVKHKNVSFCQRGMAWTWDEVHFEILHPEHGDSFKGNNLSCVLKIRNASYSVLLTGDIEKQAESRLLSRDYQKLESTILVVPHHGSRTSSMRLFVQAVSPDYALFAVGYRNRFAFPKKDIIMRYQQIDAEMLSTAENGAIEFIVGKTQVRVNAYRQDAQRFWHRR